jgi:CHAT domain-containing protein
MNLTLVGGTLPRLAACGLIALLFNSPGRTCARAVAVPARPSRDLDEIYRLYAAGQLRQAHQRLRQLAPRRLAQPELRRYWRLTFDLACESGQAREALAAAAQYRKIAGAADARELGSFAIRAAQVCDKLEQPAFGAEYLRWALGRLPPAADGKNANRAAPRSSDELSRIEVAAALARLSTRARPGRKLEGALVRSLWKPVVQDAQRWLSQHAAEHVPIEARCRCVDVLMEGLVALDRRREASAALDKLACETVETRNALVWPHWLGQLAGHYQQLGDAREAARLCQRAIALAESAVPADADEARQRNAELAGLRFAAACAYDDLGQRDRSKPLALAAAADYRALEAEAADVRQRLGDLARLEQLAELQGNLQQAISVGERWLALQDAEFEPLDPRRFSARTTLASLYVAAKAGARALELAESAWKFFSEQKPLDGQQWAAAHLVLCQAEQSAGREEKALARLEESQENWELFLPAGDLLLAKLQLQLTGILVARGEHLKALPILRNACACLEQKPDSAEAAQPLAQGLLNQALALDAQGQFQKSLDLCERSYDIRKRATPAESPAMLPYHLALCRMSLHQLIESPDELTPGRREVLLGVAETHGNLACKIVQASGLADQADAARALYQRGLLRHYREQDDDALADWRQALAIATEKKLDILSARIFVQRGALEAQRKQYEEAEASLGHAVRLLAGVNVLPALHYAALTNHAQVLLALAAKPDGAAWADGRRQQAEEDLRKAIELIEQPRAGSTGGALGRARYFARYAVAFDLLVDLYARHFDERGDAADFDQALYYADRSRNRTLLDELWVQGQQFAQTLGPAAADLLAQRDTLLGEHSRLEARIMAAADRGIDGTTAEAERQRSEALQEKLQAIKAEYAALNDRLQDAVRLRTGRPAYRLKNLGQWQKAVAAALQPGESALVYHTSAAGSHLFLLSGRGDRFHWRLHAPRNGKSAGIEAKLPLASAALTSLVEDYRQVIASRETSELLCLPISAQSTPAIDRDLVRKSKASASGSTTGVEPRAGAARLQAITLRRRAGEVGAAILPDECRRTVAALDPRRLVVVADGALKRLPLEAIVWDQAEQLVFADERLPPIAYVPSLTLLEQVADDARGSNRVQGPSLITLAVKDYSAWRPLFGEDLPDLLDAPGESRRVAEAFAQAHPRAPLRALADGSEVALRQALGSGDGCTHLHLAAHADIDRQGEGLFGRILLARSSGDNPQNDGTLFAHEVASLDLRGCELVLLSACNTNIGPEVPLECAGSLLRAFLLAGSRRVVASHWSVDDESTAALMALFMRDLFGAGGNEPVDYAASLHKARAAVRRQYVAPYYWAPFVLIGRG